MPETIDASSLAASLREAASNPPADPAVRRELYDAATALALQVERPIDTINRVTLSFGNLTTAKVLADLKVFRSIAEEPSKEWTVQQLADKSGADVQLLSKSIQCVSSLRILITSADRLLRYQATTNGVRETGPGQFSASHITPFLALPGTEAAMNHNFLTVSNNLLHLPRFLANSGYSNPSDPKNSPVHLAFNHEGDLSTWFANHPEHTAAAFTYFATQRADQPGCFLNAPIAKYVPGAKDDDDDDDKRVLLCDIGGGGGHQSLAFRAQRPELKGVLAVTDLPIMVGKQDSALLAANNIVSLADDFFSFQPFPTEVQNARMYYMRNILHDWNDERSAVILERVRKACGADSILILDELVMPDVHASVGACNYDLSMMTISAAERTLAQWRSLLAKAGFEIEQAWCYDEDRSDHLIFAKPIS